MCFMGQAHSQIPRCGSSNTATTASSAAILLAYGKLSVGRLAMLSSTASHILVRNRRHLSQALRQRPCLQCRNQWIHGCLSIILYTSWQLDFSALKKTSTICRASRARCWRQSRGCYNLTVISRGLFLHLRQPLAPSFIKMVGIALSHVQSASSLTNHIVANLQGDIQRQMEMFRPLEEPHEPLFANRGQYFSNVENAPVSPRQMPQDDSRRNNLAVPQPRQMHYYRPPVPSNLSVQTRRPYGSIGASPTATTQSSPSSLRAQVPPPPPGPHPLANVELPPGNLARRHTSADIRGNGWQPSNPPLFSSGPPSGNWPSSPSRPPNPEDQRIRDSFSHYSLQTNSQPQSRPATPPPPLFGNSNNVDNFGSWSWGKASKGENKNLAIGDGSAPPTRRGSMAHILNPTDTAERGDEEDSDPRGEEDRKRKRLQ
jgi:hypothetical protein